MKTLLVTLLLSSSLAQAVSMEEMKSMLDRTIYSCPERIWPGLDWSKKSIIVAEPSRPSAYLLKNGQVKELPASVATSFGDSYDFGQWEGEDAVYVNLEMENVDAETIFGLLVHEGFHHLAQRTPPLSAYHPQGREDRYPFKPEPRIQREELRLNLSNYLKTNASTALGQAAFWHSQAILNENSVGMDVTEGSAAYVENIALALLKHGCEADEAKIVAEMLEAIPARQQIGDKGSEPYNLGPLAFLVARPRMMENLALLDGTSGMLDVVFKDVIAIPTEARATTVEAIGTTISVSNGQAEAALFPLSTALQTGQEMLFVPFASLMGAYSAQGGFDSDIGSVLVNFSAMTRFGQVSGHALQVQACNDQHGLLILAQATPGTGTPSRYNNNPITCY